MELYLKVRLAIRDGMSAREAARHFGVSRESVKKMLSFSVPPGYRRTAPIKRPKLDGFTEIIDQWLHDDVGQHRKQRHTAKRVFDRLREEHGFTGGYTIITGPPNELVAPIHNRMPVILPQQRGAASWTRRKRMPMSCSPPASASRRFDGGLS